MINLLPYTEKKMVERVRFLRLVNTVLTGLVLLLVVTGLLFVPTILTTDTRYTIANKEIAALIKNEKLVNDVDVAELQRRASIVEQKLSQSATSFPLSYMTQIENAAPSGIQYSKLIFTAPTMIEVFGTSTGREALQSFIGALEALPSVASVDSPLSNLVKTKEGIFKVTVLFKGE